MQTFLTLEHEHETEFPDALGTEVRTPGAYVRHFIREHTGEGDAVLDPFAGFGTTLAVAEELGRVPYGVEYEAELVELVRDRIDSGGGSDAVPDERNVVHGSALELDDYDLPAFDCCLTSPPFMEREMERDPLRNYAGESDYETYLASLGDVFGQLRSLAAPDASVLLDVSNMKHEDRVTTLAWDVADAASDYFDFEGEVVVGWEGEDQPERGGGSYGYGYDHSYCLVFRYENSD